ncbi:hypothetical protein FRC08_013335 [Ceratobasidium sp. 394]|nr:hypothetical protein FRC08_013335 [Ceratobasidium sp. 394]
MPLNSESILALRGILFISLLSAVQARRWTVNNDCAYTIWPAIFTQNTSVTLSGVETGWEAAPGSSRSFVVPEGVSIFLCTSKNLKYVPLRMDGRPCLGPSKL